MAIPLFGSSSSSRPTFDDRKQAAFQKVRHSIVTQPRLADKTLTQLKAICVPLLASTKAAPNAVTSRSTIDALERLRNSITEIPDSVFTPPLANYAFFPLSALLKPAETGSPRGDAVLEATMHALAALVRKWRSCAGGAMQDEVLRQLWIMTALQLGGPLDPAGPAKSKGKGKQVDRTDESKLAMVEVLLELMGPALDPDEESLSDDEDPLGERIDWDADEPGPEDNAPVRHSSRKSPPSPSIPILYHTLTSLLEIASTPTSLIRLQLASLRALTLLITHHLVKHPPTSASSVSDSRTQGPSPLLATALPGAASTLTRIALSMPGSSVSTFSQAQRAHSSNVVVEALRLVALLLVATIGDTVTATLRHESVPSSAETSATLEEIIENFALSSDASDEVEPNSSETTVAPVPVPPAPTAGPTLPTAAWLRYTLDSVAALLASLSSLTRHESPLVRSAFVDLLAAVAKDCTLGMSERLVGPLEGLLVLAGDDWEQVSEPARAAVRAAMATQSITPAAISLIARITRSKMTSLPNLLRKRDERGVERSARAVRVALGLLATSSSSAQESGVGALGGIERWSWSLLGALELSRVSSNRRGDEHGMSQAWITGRALVGEDGPVAARMHEWPPLALRNVKDAATIVELERLWSAIGSFSAASGTGAAVVDLFLGTAMGPWWLESTSPSALLVLDGILHGFGKVDSSKAQRKLVKGIVRSVLDLLDQMDDELEPAKSAPTPGDAAGEDVLQRMNDESAAVIVEHQRGVSLTPGLDALQPVATANLPQEARESHKNLLVCLSLRLLATCAELLGSAFQPHLLQGLYHILAYLSPSTHQLVRSHAQQALALVSDSTSYASPQNLVLANVDYVVNSVSQRLSVARLDPAAPLVLVEMIRLVGQPIVPMVQDLVEDVFEALDDYHGYEEVTVGLWAVLDALMKVMAEDVSALPALLEETGAASRPDAERDWAAFVDWFNKRHDDPAEEEAGADLPQTNPREPFKSTAAPVDDNDAGGFPEQDADKLETPATRPQFVAAQIIAKALFFLSHSSPFLRSRVLSLVASAVPLLTSPSSPDDPSSTRQGDLLPVIHRSWPYILNRLADTEPYVVLAAADLIEALATHCGQFMSRRILDDVWPRFVSLVEKQQVLDRQSAIAGQSPYTTSHRLYKSVLVTMRQVAKHVPVKDEVVWDQAMLFRRFLDSKLELELQNAAVAMYRDLAVVNPDTVWIVLQGAVTGGSGGLPAGLRLAEVDLTDNVAHVLAGI